MNDNSTTVSRQRLWQRRMKAAGLCVCCGAETDGSAWCEKHHEHNKAVQRNRYRAKHGIPLDAPLWARQRELK